MKFSKLNLLLPLTVKLLIYSGDIDIDDIFNACARTSLSFDTIINTKCSSTVSAINYLLSFSNPIENAKKFQTNKVYVFELQGYRDENITETGHTFILIYDDNWLVMDSYIGYREFTYKPINFELLIDIFTKINITFNNDLWIKLTEVKNNDITTNNLDTVIYQYDYNVDTIKIRFLELIQKCKNILNTTEIGISDEYLSLLSTNLDIYEANNYLDNLTYYI